jgi:ribosomal protein L9
LHYQISEDIARRAEEFAKIEKEKKKLTEKRRKEAEQRKKELKNREKTMVEDKEKVKTLFGSLFGPMMQAFSFRSVRRVPIPT